MGIIDRPNQKHESKCIYKDESFIENANREVYIVGFNDDVVNIIWQGASPPRAEVLLWFLAMNKLKNRQSTTSPWTTYH